MPSLIQRTLFDLLDVPAFPRPAAVTDAIETLASNSGIEARGAIFTRIEAVDFILDLVGYVASEPLHHRRILEPSFGEGDFLLPIVGLALGTPIKGHCQQGGPWPMRNARQAPNFKLRKAARRGICRFPP